uniref:Uncharacterized protein n=1 Tax=Glossina austeni TaxID=7395 RepID=A0A1A9VLT8_GLOAU
MTIMICVQHQNCETRSFWKMKLGYLFFNFNCKNPDLSPLLLVALLVGFSADNKFAVLLRFVIISNSSKSGDGFCNGSIIILKSSNWFSFNCTLIGALSLCPQESARARELANVGLGVQGSSKAKLFIVAAGPAVDFVVPDVNQGSVKTLWFTVTAIGDRVVHFANH